MHEVPVDKVQSLANEGKVVVGAAPGDPHGHVVIVAPTIFSGARGHVEIDPTKGPVISDIGSHMQEKQLMDTPFGRMNSRFFVIEDQK